MAETVLRSGIYPVACCKRDAPSGLCRVWPHFNRWKTRARMFVEIPKGYVAEKLLPKPSDKLKRLTESNSLGLNGDWHSVANVDGVYFGVTKYEDPDAVSDEEDAAGFPKEFVWAYEPLALKGFGVETLMTNSVEELFADMKETAEMINEVEAKSTTLKSSKKAIPHVCYPFCNTTSNTINV